MSGAGQVLLAAPMLDRLMPMHLHLGADGTILHAGPTLVRIVSRPVPGRKFDRLFRINRPAGLKGIGDLLTHHGQPLHLSLRRGGVALRGQAVSDGAGGLLLNLSFGIGVVDAVRDHGLTEADFAPTDLAVEMLYLVEANMAVTEEFRRLSQRLDGARSTAEELALTDPLTGLRNRRAMDLLLASACAGRIGFGLMHLDLDRFKAVNDTLGHAAGDHVLQVVARVLREEIRSGDTAARVGGDEFLILLPSMTSASDLMPVAHRIIAALGRPIFHDGKPCNIGASVGLVACEGGCGALPDAVLQAADEALYAAKASGRGVARMAQPPWPGRGTETADLRRQSGAEGSEVRAGPAV